MMYRTYRVRRRDKQELLDFIVSSLEQCGCAVLQSSSPREAPFRITFEAPNGERIGIIAYAFFANAKETLNRPQDEHRFQVKYGAKTEQLHELWQDPFELYTTLFFGINLERNFFVGADPLVHSPTKFFISIEFKERNVQEIEKHGWSWWERERRTSDGWDEPVEVLVGGGRKDFLRYVRFERLAKGLDQGHRGLIADKIPELAHLHVSTPPNAVNPPSTPQAHALAEEFHLSQEEILDLIESAPRLKMAVRGWVAENHLLKYFSGLPDIECQPIEQDGKPDLMLRYRGSEALYLECKNVLRKTYSDGVPRIDFQKTRASKSDPCSRYYRPEEFAIVAACLHPCTEKWEFSFALTSKLDPHPRCLGRLSNNVRVDGRWSPDALKVISQVVMR
jgi:hypothetical protein